MSKLKLRLPDWVDRSCRFVALDSLLSSDSFSTVVASERCSELPSLGFGPSKDDLVLTEQLPEAADDDSETCLASFPASTHFLPRLRLDLKILTVNLNSNFTSKFHLD